MNTIKAKDGEWLYNGSAFAREVSTYGDVSGWRTISNEEKEAIEAQTSGELAEAKATKIAEIEAYDVSENVNSFSYQGASFWLDKDTRVGLVNSTNMLIASGHEDTTLWLGDVSVTLKCDQVLQMLCALECYALECYNVTARHKAEVKALKSVLDVEQYDIPQGYPTKLAF